MFAKNNIFNINAFLFLFLMLVLPSFLHGFFGASSLSLGLLLASILVFFFVRKDYLPSLLLSLFYIIFFAHYFIGLVFFDFKVKSFFSFFSFIFLVFVAYQVSSYIFNRRESYYKIDDSILCFLFFLIFIMLLAVISDFRFGKFFYNTHKPVFPFTEPSHAALAIAPFYTFGLLRLSKKYGFLLFSSLMFFSIIMQSFLLLIISFSCYFLFGIRGSLKFPVFFVALVPFIYFLFSNDYYYQRLSLSNSSTNLTALVYLQGIQDAFNSLKNTDGFGLGFQMLGYQPPSEAHYRIVEIMGENDNHPGLNRFDGGFLAAKVIAEFGLIGVFFVVYYVFLLIFVIIKIANLQYSEVKKMDPVFLLALCSIFSFSYELFVRGVGYFSPGVFLFLCSIFYLMKIRNIEFIGD